MCVRLVYSTLICLCGIGNFVREVVLELLLHSSGSQSRGIDIRVPLTGDLLSWKSNSCVIALISNMDAQYSAAKETRERKRELMYAELVFSFPRRTSQVLGNLFPKSSLSCFMNVTRNWAIDLRRLWNDICYVLSYPIKVMLNFRLASLLFSWKQDTYVLAELCLSLQFLKYSLREFRQYHKHKLIFWIQF